MNAAGIRWKEGSPNENRVVAHRRLLGWGTTMSDMPSMVRIVRSLIELAPDTRTRFDHARVGERAYIRQISQFGTRDGGAASPRIPRGYTSSPAA